MVADQPTVTIVSATASSKVRFTFTTSSKGKSLSGIRGNEVMVGSLK
jgi:hypothetical protein